VKLATRYLLFALGAALFAAPAFLGHSTRSLPERLFGPLASAAATIEWVRVDLALRQDQPELAYARAERALELAPSRADGWIFLARHFVYQRAALAREADPAARRRWVEAGLDLLARGERESAAAAELAYERGVVLSYLAWIAVESEAPAAERPDARDARTLFLAAAEAFERAAGLGHPGGASAAQAVRERAEDAGR